MIYEVFSVLTKVPFGICKQKKILTRENEAIHRLDAKGKNISQMKFELVSSQGENQLRTIDEHCREILFHEGNPDIQEGLIDQLDGLQYNKKTNFIDCSTIHGKILNYRFLRDIMGVV